MYPAYLSISQSHGSKTQGIFLIFLLIEKIIFELFTQLLTVIQNLHK